MGTIFDYLESSKQQMLDFTIKQANINSATNNLSGIENVAVNYKQAFCRLGCQYEQIASPQITQWDKQGVMQQVAVAPSLRFWHAGSNPKLKILCVGHMDTVFSVDSAYQTTRIEGDKLYGPGVADMKGGISVLLWALTGLMQSKLASKVAWEVILNADEEIGSLSSTSLLQERAAFYDIGLVYEPSLDRFGKFAGERKGSGKFTIVALGQKAHAGRNFTEGKNAIYALSCFMERAHELNKSLEGVTVNIGCVRGGDAVNVVPDKAVCKLDIRIANNDLATIMESKLQEICTEVEMTTGCRLELHGAFVRQPKAITGKTADLYAALQQAGTTLGQSIAWSATGGCCDGNTLAAVGLPNIDTMGVIGSGIHSEDEYLVIDSLVSRAKLTIALLEQLLRG